MAFPDLAGRDPVLCLREFMPLSTLYVGAIQLLAAFLPLFLMLSGASRQENFRQILDDGAASGIVSWDLIWPLSLGNKVSANLP